MRKTSAVWSPKWTCEEGACVQSKWHRWSARGLATCSFCDRLSWSKHSIIFCRCVHKQRNACRTAKLNPYWLCRLVPKRRMISIGKTCFPWTSTCQYIIEPRIKCVPWDILNMCTMCMFRFGLSGSDCTKDENKAEEVRRLRRRTSCAVLGS